MAINKYKKICYLCGKEYRYCSNCRQFKTQPTWKNMFDTENCYKIFSLSTQFAQGTYTKEEANELLKTYDISDIDMFRPDAVEQLKIIQTAEKVIPKTIETADVDSQEKSKADEKLDNANEKDVFKDASNFKKKKKSMKKASTKVFNEQ
jgi:hypothetical protein